MSKRLCGAVLLGQVLDAVTFAVFYLMPHHVESGASEQNFIVAWFLLAGGPALVVGVKEMVGYIVWIVGPRIRSTPAFLWALRVAALLGFAGAIFNSIAIWKAI